MIEPCKPTTLAPLAIQLIRDLSLARRERDLAIELLVVANDYIRELESRRRLHDEFDRAMVQVDQQRYRFIVTSESVPRDLPTATDSQVAA